jgi:CoA:oxalate CoA-transferase
MSLRPSTVAGPLNGIVVVDLTRVLAGPYCTMVLADLGARVIKVEMPPEGDIARGIGPFINGRSAYFASLNRGKESLSLDLKVPADRALFEALLAEADVLVENFRPGVMEKLGYGWQGLHARFPRLVYAAASGFGQTGPYSHRPAYDMVVQAMGGLMSVTGHPGAPPTRVGSSIGDITAGLFTAIGINAALLHRANTGEAIQVDVAMLDGQVAILENAIARYAATGQVPGPIGARHPSIAPFAAFATADGHVVIAAAGDEHWAVLARVLNRPNLVDDPRFRTLGDRVANVEEMQVEMEKALAADTTANWLAKLEAAKLPCGPINNVAQVLADPHVRARNMVVSIDDPELGHLEMAGNPIKLSGFPDPETRGRVPPLDEARARLLAELGLDAEKA